MTKQEEICHKCVQEDMLLSTVSLHKQGSLLDENQEEDWSLSNQGQQKWRAGIQAILTDHSLVPVEKRITIHQLLMMNECHCFSSSLRFDVESAKHAELKRPEEVFGCCICYDDFSSLPAPIMVIRDKNQINVCCSSSNGTCSMSTKMNGPQNHEIDHFAIVEVICHTCYTQPSSKVYGNIETTALIDTHNLASTAIVRSVTCGC
eukprot:scaffold190404_cov67-Attheya_sp.AAC.2